MEQKSLKKILQLCKLDQCYESVDVDDIESVIKNLDSNKVTISKKINLEHLKTFSSSLKKADKVTLNAKIGFGYFLVPKVVD